MKPVETKNENTHETVLKSNMHKARIVASMTWCLVDWWPSSESTNSPSQWHTIQLPTQLLVVHEAILCNTEAWRWGEEGRREFMPVTSLQQCDEEKHLVKEITVRIVVLNRVSEINYWSWRWQLRTVSEENINGWTTPFNVHHHKEFVCALSRIQRHSGKSNTWVGDNHERTQRTFSFVDNIVWSACLL